MAYVDDIIAALGNNRNDASVRKQAAQDIVNVLQRNKRPVNNVEVVEDSYMPNGLMYTRFPEPQQAPVEEDILVPNRPNIDWNERQGVSYAGGLGLDDNSVNTNNVSIPVANDNSAALAARSAVQEPAAVPQKEALINAFAGGIEDTNTEPARRRYKPWQEALMLGLDLVNISSATPNVMGYSARQPGSAYLGQTMETLNKLDKIRMEQDPEGYSIDLNRAKVLSQKALTEEDPAKKAMYGREIKKLLPQETQGLDDLTASEFFTAGADSKLKLEQLKGYNKLQQIQLQNSGKMDLQQLKNASNEDIARLKTSTQWDIASLNNEYKKAIADGNNERALTVAQMVTDRQKDLADINNAVKLKQTEMQQEGANYRTGLQQTGAMERVQAQQAGAMARTQAQQAGALERAKITAASKANGDAGMAQGFKESIRPEMLNRMKELNESAGRWDYAGNEEGTNIWQRIAPGSTYAVSVQRGDKKARNFQEFQAYAQQIVNSQLKKILGGQFTEAEGERVLSSFGINPKMSPEVRWRAFVNGINNLAAKYGIEDRIPLDNGQEKKATGASKIKSVKRIG